MPHSILLNVTHCPICLEQFKSPVIAKCGHSFCNHCIILSIKVRTECPVCSDHITADLLIPNLALQQSIHGKNVRNEQLNHALLLQKRQVETNEQREMNSIIGGEFLKLLECDRLEKLKEIEKELATISAIKSTLDPNLLFLTASTTTTKIGQKRKLASVIDEESLQKKLERVQENFDSLSSSFSKCADWEEFKSQLRSISKSYQLKELAGFKQSGILSNASQIISSIEPDSTDSFFAAAGVSKRISIYNMSSIINSNDGNNVSMRHYPILDIKCSSKISCLSWNPYFSNLISSADYDGIINMYDSTTGQVSTTWSEHEKRCWSIDTSPLDPFRIISGSDDCKVKLWSQKTPTSVLTMDLRANVCSVRFSPVDANLVAVGAADHRVFLIDLRKASSPIFNEKQHKKSVSYVRFTDDNSIVSSSTDCTLKLWPTDRNKSTRSYSGHVNEKNFVGLSLSGDLYTTGSEDNSVYIYNRLRSSPILKYQMNTQCPLTGVDMSDEVGTFVSSVTWSKRLDQNGNQILLAANSTGNIKILSLYDHDKVDCD